MNTTAYQKLDGVLSNGGVNVVTAKRVHVFSKFYVQFEQTNTAVKGLKIISKQPPQVNKTID